jgi:hypothetical protein
MEDNEVRSEKMLKTFCAAVALSGTAMLALSISAEARCMDNDCKGPIVDTKVNTTYHYNTVQRGENVTRYNDVDRPHPVANVHRIVEVTRVQPVVHVNHVTRVHNQTENLHEMQHSAQTETLPAQSVMSNKTVDMGGNIPEPKVSTEYKYNTVDKVSNVTKYNDVTHTQYVKHIDRVVDVTRVQPVVHTSVVTRIHDRPVFSVKNEILHETRMLPARTIDTGKVIRTDYMPAGRHQLDEQHGEE